MFDRSDPAMFWLSVTNLALGVVVAICLATVLFGVIRELSKRNRMRGVKLPWGDEPPPANRS